MNQISRMCPWINSFAHSREPQFTPEECKQIIEDDRIIERCYGKLQGKSHKWFITRN